MRTAVLTVTLLASLLRPTARDAHACGNSYTHYYLLSSATRELDAAERALLQGSFGPVVATANRVVRVTSEGRGLRSFPRGFREDNNLAPNQWEAEVSDDALDGASLPTAAPDAVAPITVRARMLRGIAIARRDGQFNSVLTPIRRATPSQREARFQTALDDLAAAVAANPTDTRARAYQAEARARRDPSERAGALLVLRDLARRDVLSDPWSWAQLARLEDNDAARAAALARCTAMAGRNAAPRLRAVTLRPLALALLALLCACRRASPPAPPRPARVLPAAAQVRAGRALLQRFECARCHDLDDIDRPPLAQDCVGCHRRVHAGTIPARAEHRDAWRRNLVDLVDAPALTALGARLEPAWIEAFLLRPDDLRPGLRATMPRLDLTPAQARDLAAALTRDPDPASPPLATPATAHIALGRRLFHQLGCPRCHGFRDAVQVVPAPAPTDENRLAPDLSLTRRRFRLTQLAAWIRWPSRLKPQTPMPALTRSDDEAVALASYVWFAPLAPAPTVRVPAMLPVLARRVAWPEVAEAVFLRTCRHCHADASLAFGDGGPGNTGGFGFAARRLELATYAGALAGMMVRGERQSAFAVDASGMPRLVHALRARQLEEAGVVEEGIRGMPLGHPSLTPEALQLVTSWIASGRPVE